MSPVLNEVQMIEKLKADIAQREAKLKEKDDLRKARIRARITAKEELIKKLDAEILKLTEELGDDVAETGDKQDAAS